MPVSSSKKTLPSKLGIKTGMEVLLLNPPRGYLTALGKLPRGCKLLKTSSAAVAFVHVFAASRKDLKASLPGLKRRLLKDGALWISWPKKAAGHETDLSDRCVRDLGIEAGLVDTKVCAIDDTWSALKFVYPVKAR